MAGKFWMAGRANPPTRMSMKSCWPITALGVRHRPMRSGEAASGYHSTVFVSSMEGWHNHRFGWTGRAMDSTVLRTQSHVHMRQTSNQSAAATTAADSPAAYSCIEQNKQANNIMLRGGRGSTRHTVRTPCLPLIDSPEHRV